MLSSVQGRLQGVIKHHRCDELVAFAGDLLEMIEDELETIDARYRKKTLKTEHLAFNQLSARN